MIKYIIIGVLVVLAIVLMPVAEAQTFEGNDNYNFLFFEKTNHKVDGFLRIDEKIIHFESEIKFYKNGLFKINISNPKLILIGTPEENSYNVKIFDVKTKLSYSITINELITIPIKEKHTESQFTPLFEEPAANNTKTVDTKRIIPRSDYTFDTTKSIAILSQIPDRISVDKFFDFDIRIVDPSKNNMFDYFRTDGYINDVIIDSIIKDSEGIIMNNFTGVTEKDGHYGAPEKTYFDYHMNLRDAFILEINATKYFDDEFTFTNTNMLKEFFVYIPSSSSNAPFSCPEGSHVVYDKDNDLYLCEDD